MHWIFFITPNFFPHIFYKYNNFFYVLNKLPHNLNHEFIAIVVFILVIFLRIGYSDQIRSNRSYLWDSYRRYELGKDLYAKYEIYLYHSV